MNTEHLFGIYWGAQRLKDQARTRRATEPGSQPAVRTTDAARDAAYERLFDAVRQAVEDSRYRL